MMPKIKVKNIPTIARMRMCYNNMCGCSGCSLNAKDADVKCMISPKYHQKETTVDIPEKNFPTNREWLESLSDEDLAAFYTHGVLIERYSPFPVNLHQIVGNFVASEQGVKEWLSQPCRYLMEVDTDAENQS